MNRTALLLSFAVATSLPATAAEPAARKVPTPARPKAVTVRRAGFPGLKDRYVAAFFRRFPVVATYFGAEGLDPANAALNGQLRDYTPAALRAERDEWLGFQQQLARFDRKGLSPADRIDAEVMSAQLAFLLRNLDRARHERALDVYLEEPLRGVEWLLQGMASSDGKRYGTREEWAAVADRVGAVPGYLKVALANVRRGAGGNGIPDRRLIRSATESAATTADYFAKSLPEKAGTWMDPSYGETKGRLVTASKAAAAAFRELGQGLRDLFYDKAGKTLRPEFDKDRFAVGETEYAWALKNNLKVTKGARELHAYGKTKVGETLLEMTGLARRIARAHDWTDDSLPAVIAKLSEEVPKSDDEMLAWYQDGCRRLVEFGRTTGMFAPPSDYELDVVFTPVPLRDTVDAAYYPAPAFKKTGVGQFYVTPTGNDPNALRQHARSAIASLAAHEGFPGHDWYYQFLRSRSSEVSPVRWLTPGGVEDSASMWADSMSCEGWALYCERLVGEARPGFPDGFYTPEERLFQLQNQLLRDARVVIDTGIHCGFLSFDDAVAYLAKNVLFVTGAVSTDPKLNESATERSDVEVAEKAVFRYSKWPTQAITYHLGKAEILALRDEARAIEGADFDERRFHEELLLQGTIPPGLFRDVLLSAARARAAAKTQS